MGALGDLGGLGSLLGGLADNPDMACMTSLATATTGIMAACFDSGAMQAPTMAGMYSEGGGSGDAVCFDSQVRAKKGLCAALSLYACAWEVLTCVLLLPP